MRIENMSSFRSAAWTSIGKKVWTGLTGLFLSLFVLVHLLGNLAYFESDPNSINRYAYFLHSLGPLFYIIEIVLLVAIVLHVMLGIVIYIRRKRLRPVEYAVSATRGGPSKKNFSSKSMIWTGIILLVFIVIHLQTFKWGPGIDDGYVATEAGEELLIDGKPVKDVHQRITDVFKNEIYVIGYVAVMIFLGFHLRHGVWSAFQSLGANNPRISPILYTIGGIFAVLIAFGFLFLPIYVYFFV
jgi:succinate dehydrogenase / fumarate reductase, cytochrome b subunit